MIETAIVVLIGGLLLASTSTLLLTYVKKVQLSTTEKRLGAIDEALQIFLNFNGRYPCPAIINAAVDSPDFGVEKFAASSCDTTPQIPGRDGRPVRVGGVPVRTLNLPDEFGMDAWGGRLTYAVTENLAEDGTYNRTEGAISVVDSTDPADPAVDSVVQPPGSAHYVIVSHGANNSGATSAEGGGAMPCTTGNLEEENCDGDDTFRTTLLLGTAQNAMLYDDLVSVRAMTAFGNQVPEGAVMAFNLNACPSGWVEFTPAGGRFLVGVSAEFALGITGGLETVTLTPEQTGFREAATPINPAAAPGGVISAETTGAIQEHENMPPYIAMRFCQKS